MEIRAVGAGTRRVVGRNASGAEYAEEKARMAETHGVPTVDVFREGADALVKAAIQLRKSAGWS